MRFLIIAITLALMAPALAACKYKLIDVEEEKAKQEEVFKKAQEELARTKKMREEEIARLENARKEEQARLDKIKQEAKAYEEKSKQEQAPLAEAKPEVVAPAQEETTCSERELACQEKVKELEQKIFAMEEKTKEAKITELEEKVKKLEKKAVEKPNVVVVKEKATSTVAPVKSRKLTGWVRLYDDKGFTDRRLTVSFGQNIGNMHYINSDDGKSGFNDKASAVKFDVPPGWKAVLYENSNYSKRAYPLKGKGAIADLGYFGDKTSSIRWEKQ